MRDKFLLTGHPDTAHLFELESKTILSRSNGFEAKRNRKIILLSISELTYWEQNRRDRKYKIYNSRYSVGTAREALINTLDAELWSRGPRLRPTRCVNIEIARKKLYEEMTSDK